MKANGIKRSISAAIGFMRGLRRDQRGAVAIIVALAAVPLFGFAGLAIDIGYALSVKSALQTSTDAAVLAGAQDLNCCTSAPSQAVTTATSYGSVAGGKNLIPGVTVTMASGSPQMKCFTSLGISCTGVSAANGLVVTQTAAVPTFFARVFGISTISVSATAAAASAGGKPTPLDVMLVLDTTQSMNNADPKCGITGATKLTCAEAGVQTILNTLAPSVDYIGLMVFPGVTSTSQAALDTNCGKTNPTIASYKNSPVYTIAPLSGGYRASDSATSLSSGSAIASASGGVSGCTGLKAVGGVGTFFADAITAAQTALTQSSRTVQKVIITLSDGDASASSSNMPTGKATNQCKQAVTAAQSATAAGTWVYSIAYGASTSGCSTDTTPTTTPCKTMTSIASDPSKFYSDNSAGCPSSAQNSSLSGLISFFKSISQSLLPPRLIPDSTT
jgi:Flp pilus assembly protein TadG